MLTDLYVKNYALIEEARVSFQKGLNILTGETGAGKSIIIGSIDLALGGRADKDMIRTGAEYALVELTFRLDDEAQREKCRELELETDGDVLVLSRKISPGRSVCRAGGEMISAKALRELAQVLIDVYGQHEHQSLTEKRKQLAILDDFCAEKLAGIKEKLAEEYKRYGALLKEWKESDTDSGARGRECELLRFECAEIEEARLRDGEEEEVEADYRRMANARKILEATGTARSILGDTEGENISDLLGRALRELKGIEAYDEKLAQFTQQLGELEALAADIRRELADYEETLELDPEAFDRTQRRMETLAHLKSRYGNTVGEILRYQKEQEERLEKLSHYDSYLEELKENLDGAKKTVLGLCRELSDLRRQQAALLSEQMKEALRDLNFLEADFEIRISSDENDVSASGYDEASFWISVNPGEPMKALENVASGGELSRIMLALKTVMARRDAVDTLIFDEIDAGISGRTAWQVSRRLALLAGEHQVICITHLPQIAAMADCHFKIEKRQEGEHTRTQIDVLEETESIEELARLLGSDALTQAALSNAREMKAQAADTKNRK